MSFRAYAKAAGIDPESVKFVPAPPPALPQLMASGQVDAIGQFVVGEPLIAAVANGRKVVVLPFGKLLPELYGTVLMTSTKLASKNPDQVRRFSKALLRGLVYAAAHPEEAAEILASYQPTQNKAVAQKEVELLAPYVGAADKVGNIDRERVVQSINILAAAIKKPMSARGYRLIRLGSRESWPVIAIEGISQIFATKSGTVQALQDVSFDVEANEFVTLVGRSGCGKSTLLRVISGLLAPTEGTVKIDGEPVRRPRRDVSFMFQKPALLPWRSVLENVMLPAEFLKLDEQATRKRALDLIELAGLSGFENSLPHQLSGGMQQRVSLCRSLVQRPKVLLMDEPFSALDPLTREELAIELQRIVAEESTTIVFVTHSIEEAVLLSDRVVVLWPRPGRIREIVPIRVPRPRDLGSPEQAEQLGGFHQQAPRTPAPPRRGGMSDLKTLDGEYATLPHSTASAWRGWPSDRARVVLLPVVTLIAVILLWAGATAVLDIPAYLVPSPQSVVAKLAEHWLYLMQQLAVTLGETSLPGSQQAAASSTANDRQASRARSGWVCGNVEDRSRTCPRPVRSTTRARFRPRHAVGREGHVVSSGVAE